VQRSQEGENALVVAPGAGSQILEREPRLIVKDQRQKRAWRTILGRPAIGFLFELCHSAKKAGVPNAETNRLLVAR
jgi:hypothetical protein